jgi:hypothetical protein
MNAVLDRQRSRINEHVLQYSFGFAKHPAPPAHMIDFLTSSDSSAAIGRRAI